jgi:nicotinamide-nucleotide amidase
MKAEIVAIGDELTSGQRPDTNSAWLSERLGEIGIPVLHHSVVGDDLDAMVDVLSRAMARADVIIVTGGLGPTDDDLTRQALAEAAHRPLVLDEGVLNHIRALFARRGRNMPEKNAVQARFPAGSRVIPNPDGTAPGIHLELVRDGQRTVQCFALPGVPAEMSRMWLQSVGPAFEALAGPHRRFLTHRLIHCFGAGESDVEARLPDLIRRGREPLVGITASGATITLRITAHGESRQQCRAATEATAAVIYESLGTLVFGEGDDQLQDVVVRMLHQNRLSLAVAECGTGGLVASWLAATGDSSACFRGAMVVRDERALSRLLDGPDVSAFAADPVRTVTGMAQAIRRQLDADVGLAVGPFPEQAGGHGDPVRVHFALADARGTRHDSLVFAAHPAIQRQRAAKQALNLLRLQLLARV